MRRRSWLQWGRFMADRIARARLLEVGGTDHAPGLTDPDTIASEIEEFLTGTRHVREPGRTLATVLLTDIVSSTEAAARLGDARWRALLERHDEVTRAQLSSFRGREVKSTGDGFLATFEGPARPIRCAEAIRGALENLDIEIRAGIHTGECETMGNDVGGLAVHIAARVSALAAPGEILVSRTVRDLVVGSGIGFSDRGVHELKGVPGRWEVLAVEAAGPPSEAPEGEVARMETPAAAEACGPVTVSPRRSPATRPAFFERRTVSSSAARELGLERLDALVPRRVIIDSIVPPLMGVVPPAVAAARGRFVGVDRHSTPLGGLGQAGYVRNLCLRAAF